MPPTFPFLFLLPLISPLDRFTHPFMSDRQTDTVLCIYVKSRNYM